MAPYTLLKRLRASLISSHPSFKKPEGSIMINLDILVQKEEGLMLWKNFFFFFFYTACKRHLAALWPAHSGRSGRHLWLWGLHVSPQGKCSGCPLLWRQAYGGCRSYTPLSGSKSQIKHKSKKGCDDHSVKWGCSHYIVNELPVCQFWLKFLWAEWFSGGRISPQLGRHFHCAMSK